MLKKKLISLIIILLFSSPCYGAFPTTGVLDDFNRDNGPLGANWTAAHTFFGTDLSVVSGNQFAPTSGDYVIVYYNVSTYGASCEAYVTVVTRTTVNGDGPYVGARLQQACDSAPSEVAHTLDGYFAAIELATTGNWRIYRMDDGTNTQLGDTVVEVSANGEKIGIECVGDQISCYRYSGAWELQMTRTDATYGNAGYNALYGGSDDANYRLDDFSGGTISGEPQGIKKGLVIRIL